MKILVAVKRVIDYNVRVRVKRDGSGVDLDHVKMSMNPFDEVAVEEALRIREKGQCEEAIAVSVGPDAAQTTLRTALAMGMDRAIHVTSEHSPNPLTVAKILKAIVAEEQPGLIILGKQAIDDDCHQTGQMLAALLDRPQASCASRMTLEDDAVIVECEVDGGLQTLRLSLPAIVTTDLRLNQPRYASLPNIMKAKRKPLAVHNPESLGVTPGMHIDILETIEPPARKTGMILSSVAELVDKLKNEAGVLP